ncbi:MAG: MCP four helix bundle domain-containing protein, partial [Sphingomonadaceae bacterium]
MKWFYDLKIGSKLRVSFGAVAVLTLVLGVTNILSMGRVNQASHDLTDNWMPSVQAVMTMRIDVGDLRRWQLAHLLNDDPAKMATYEQRIDATLAAMTADRATYVKLISSPEEQALYDSFSKNWDAFLVEHRKLLALSRSEKKSEARELAAGGSAQAMTVMSEQLGQLVQLNVGGGRQASADAAATYLKARWTSIVLLVVNVVVGMLLAMWLARIVSVPLQRAVGGGGGPAPGGV